MVHNRSRNNAVRIFIGFSMLRRTTVYCSVLHSRNLTVIASGGGKGRRMRAKSGDAGATPICAALKKKARPIQQPCPFFVERPDLATGGPVRATLISRDL
jgi:hypothetical protein